MLARIALAIGIIYLLALLFMGTLVLAQNSKGGAASPGAVPATAAFTYQGRLLDGGAPMGVGALFLAGGFIPGAVAPPPNSLQAHPWPMFRHDSSHRAMSPYVGYGAAELKWSFTAGDVIYSSPVIASDGAIYFGSHDGYLYALNPNGALKWKFPVGGRIHSSPAIGADGTIYVGNLDTFKLHAVTPAGVLKWIFTAGGALQSSPTIGPDGAIYVGSNDDKLYALNPDGSQRWSYTTGGDVVPSAALAADGTIYVGSDDGYLYAVNPDGSLKWTYYTSGGMWSSPAVAQSDGTIYIGANNGYFYAVWPNGTQRWYVGSFSVAVFSSPAVEPGGAIYFGANTYLYAYKPDGTQKWARNLNGYVYSSPAIGADGAIYVGSHDNKLYAVNPTDGTVKWSYLTGGGIDASPAIGADGAIYITSLDKKLYAIGQRVPVAVTSFTTGVDTDGVAGLVTAILQVKDPVTGDPKPDVKIGGYRSTLSYPSNMAQVADCRLKAPLDNGECNVDNIGGTARVSAVDAPGAPWPINPLAFVAVKLTSCVGQVGAANVFYEEIVDVNSSPLSPESGLPLQRGDANGDGLIGIGDPLFIAQYVVGLRGLGVGPDKVNAVNASSVRHDVGLDKISVADALFLLQYLVGLRDSCMGLLVPPVTLVAQEMASGLQFPSSFAIAPDGRVFTTERSQGTVRVLKNWQKEADPWATLSVAQGGEKGLLGLVLHPGFPQAPYVYVYYTYMDGNSVYNRVSRLREENGKAVEEQVLLNQMPGASYHIGGVLAFGSDGKLYITTGDTTNAPLAQDPSSLAGKVLRLNDDGTVPQDNPIPGSPVYTLGHRNVFGIAFRPASGQPYITENGPNEDDELNRLLPGANYGWPLHLGIDHAPGFEDPILAFGPVQIAPTQAVFYTGYQLPGQYRGNLFFGDWNTGSLHRVVLDMAGDVEEHGVVLSIPGNGIVDVEQGPDGQLYFSTATAIYRVVVQP